MLAVSERYLLSSQLYKSLQCAHIWPRLRRNLSEQKFFRPYSSPDQGYDAARIAMRKQWKAYKERNNDSRYSYEPPSKKRKTEKAKKAVKEGSHDEILHIESLELLDNIAHVEQQSASLIGNNTASQFPRSQSRTGRFDQPEELELEIRELSSTGDGLAVSPDGKRVYVVPFGIPGDKVLAKAFYLDDHKPYTNVDFIKVIKPSPQRDDTLAKCKYFQQCAGCQLQMMTYEDQLAHKRTIVEKAYRHFSGLSSHQIPQIADTIGSPLQYEYRTKLSPHFDGPPRGPSGERGYTQVPNIGYTMKGRKKVMDIESCPIGTDIVQEGLKSERVNVAKNISKYKNGATILLRESTERMPKSAEESSSNNTNAKAADQDSSPSPSLPPSKELTTTSTGKPLLKVTSTSHTDLKTCVTDSNAFSTEYIDSYRFTSRAGSFFQNNNSILPRFTAYVRNNAFPPILNPSDPPIKYLLDAYCGSGLFAVTLSSLFTSALGIDIDPKGVEAARINAEQNAITNAGFIEADASALFADVPFPPKQTLVVIDPPRKGASEDFLRQLMQFGPKRVIYVSCNVHTQARDIGVLVSAKGFDGQAVGGWKYEIESLRGFDFFPQTGHVEGVAFLNRVENVMM